DSTSTWRQTRAGDADHAAAGCPRGARHRETDWPIEAPAIRAPGAIPLLARKRMRERLMISVTFDPQRRPAWVKWGKGFPVGPTATAAARFPGGANPAVLCPQTNGEESMPAERFDFPNAQGQKLAALLDRPTGEPRAYALFAHCFTCGKDVHAARRVADGLTTLGIAVLRFDFTGLGSSEGEFANTSFSSNVADLVAAANELRRRARAPAILIGHSLGGTAVLAAAADVPEARGVVTIAAPCDPTHVTGLFKDRLEDVAAKGEIEATLAGRQFCISRAFVDDLAEHKLMERIANLRKALLI